MIHFYDITFYTWYELKQHQGCGNEVEIWEHFEKNQNLFKLNFAYSVTVDTYMSNSLDGDTLYKLEW